ncbi:unnamed protein product [Rotaria sp. Silwood1]|nr:unnamed protein product [Rotaria sp. Silwood1]CAF4912884.1 unnamed protein product [Rotaria sp. Silwood1]
MMAIEMTGAVYCPLPPQSPDQRLLLLLEQTRSRLVLVHGMTRDRFSNDISTVDIDATMNGDAIVSGYNADCLLSVMVTPECVATIVFTSGSTGTPKAVIP